VKYRPELNYSLKNVTFTINSNEKVLFNDLLLKIGVVGRTGAVK
jgi:ABC-type multidrug transport system fused ATPase/permease subunit